MVQTDRPSRLAQTAVTFSAGAVVAIFTVIASASFAALIFAGPVRDFVSSGIYMALVTAVVVGSLVALTSSCRGAIAIPQDRIAPILALLGVRICAGAPAATPEQLCLAILSAIVLVTLLTGLFLYALGRLRLGNLIRYIPYPVIGGFLAGSGWLLALGGIRVMAGHPITFETLPALCQPAEVARWVPGVVFGIAVFAVMRRVKNQLLVTAMLLGAIALFYCLLALSGHSLAEARSAGFLPRAIEQVSPRQITHFSILKVSSWWLPLHHCNILATILLTSVVSILLTASALELTTQQEIDLNRELRCAGAATFVAGLCGGMVGFHSLSMSRLVLSMGTRSKWVGVIAGALCALALCFNLSFVSFVPQCVCGGLLFFLGLVFLWEWGYEAARKLTRLDYLVVLLILAVVGLVGYPEGVATGIVAAVVLFVHNYSRVRVVSHALSGADMRSNVDRPVRELRRLRESGEQVFVLRLQGFIFFGTATHLHHEVKERANDPGRQRVRFAILDFRRVSGLDSSAVFSLSKVHQLARKLGFTLIMTQVNPEITRQLALGGLRATDWPSFRLFPDLDHALEWCEDLLLSTGPREAAQHGAGLAGQLQDLWPPEVHTDRLMPYLERQEVPAGAYLIRQAENSESLYFIESGLVTVRLELGDSRFLRLRTMGAGTVVGEVGLFLGGKRTASVVAENACTVHRLTRGAFERMSQEDSGLALAFHRYVVCLLAERLTNTGNMLRSLSE